MNKKYRVLFYHSTSIGCKYYRADNIKKALESTGKFEVILTTYINSKDWLTFDKETEKPTHKNFDLVVMQRSHQDRNRETMKLLKRAGIPVIYDIDDLFHDIDKFSPAFKPFDPNTAEGKKNLMNVEWLMKVADAITVSTVSLKNIYGKLNPTTFLVPNLVDLDMFKGVEKKDNGDTIVIGYAGSATHLSDVLECEDAICQVVNEFPNVKLGLGGHDFKTKKGTAYCFGDIPDEKKIVYPWVESIPEYCDMISNFDIGIAPLKDTDFNSCKSNIKFLEYSTIGIPTVCSRVDAYDCVENNRTGISIKTGGAKHSRWYKALKRLVQDEELRKEMSACAKDFVLNDYNLEKQGYLYSMVYTGIIEKYPRKDQQLPTLPEDKWTWRSKKEEKKLQDAFMKKFKIETSGGKNS